MNHPHVLIQLDSDLHASSFDAVVAVDSGVGQLLQYASVNEQNIVGLVHGAMFTRGPEQLKHTAIFVGGSNVESGERLVAKILATFFGPIRVSVMLDSNGANTTAVAAVLSAAKHIDLSTCKAVVLGGTGPVGQRVAQLIVRQGGHVWLASRSHTKATEVCQNIQDRLGLFDCPLQPFAIDGLESQDSPLREANLVISCGAAGTTLLKEEQLVQAANLQVAIDLNAVPPTGIVGIGAMDKGTARGHRFDYGAIGVGGLKMKIHRAGIHALFERNDRVLDAEELFKIGQALLAKVSH